MGEAKMGACMEHPRGRTKSGRAPSEDARRHSPWMAALALCIVLGALPAPAGARLAYVANGFSTMATIETTDLGVATLDGPSGTSAVAITPDGGFVYAINAATEAVSILDTTTNEVVDRIPLPRGSVPFDVVVDPAGAFAYVTLSGTDEVAVIDIQPSKPRVTGFIATGEEPRGIAITPDGELLVVANFGSGSIHVIDAASGEAMAEVGLGGSLQPQWDVAVTPDGKLALVSGYLNATVSVVSLEKFALDGGTIDVGREPTGIAITPNGRYAYVASRNPEGAIKVQVIDIEADPRQVTANITGGGSLDDARDIAITPDGRWAYVANAAGDKVAVVDTETNRFPYQIEDVGAFPLSLAITPDQSPKARFSSSAESVEVGVPVLFDGQLSEDIDGKVAGYRWDFGDNTPVIEGKDEATQIHTYLSPGSYTVRLRVTDDEGCSQEFVSGGKTAYCSGSVEAEAVKTITVSGGGESHPSDPGGGEPQPPPAGGENGALGPAGASATVPPAATSAPGAVDTEPPRVTVKRPRRHERLKRRSLKTIRGTASDESGVRAVSYALARVERKARPRRGIRRRTRRCRYLRPSGKLRRRPRSCRARGRLYLKAKGTAVWRVRLRRRLPRGSYALYVYAVDNAGNRSRDRRVTFKVR